MMGRNLRGVPIVRDALLILSSGCRQGTDWREVHGLDHNSHHSSRRCLARRRWLVWPRALVLIRSGDVRVRLSQQASTATFSAVSSGFVVRTGNAKCLCRRPMPTGHLEKLRCHQRFGMIGAIKRHGGATMAQMGFFDLSDRYASLDAKKDPLVEIDAVVP